MISSCNLLSAQRRLLCGTLCELQLYEKKAGSVILRRLLCSGMNWLKSLRSAQPTDRNWYTTALHVLNGIEVQTLRRKINRVCTIRHVTEKLEEVGSWFLMYKYTHVVYFRLCFVCCSYRTLVHIWFDKLDSARTNFNDNANATISIFPTTATFNISLIAFGYWGS